MLEDKKPKQIFMFEFSGLLPASTLRLKEVHRIALICYGGLGDVLLFSSVIRELRQWLPEIHITLYVEDRSAGVFKVLEGVDAVLAMPISELSRPAFFRYLVRDVKMRHFDGILSTGTNPFISAALAMAGVRYRVGYESKPWANRLLSYAVPVRREAYASAMYLELAKAFLKPLIGPAYTPEKAVALPFTKPSTEETLARMEALKIFPLPPHRKHVLIHPGVSQASKRKGIHKDWAPKRWAQFILDVSRDHAVYLIGGPDDESAVTAIMKELPENMARFRNLCGQTKGMDDLAALMQTMDAVCVVDSAPLHLAVALEKPLLAFFGPTNDRVLVPYEEAWAPLQVVRRFDLDCQPCLWQKRQRNCEASDCLDVSVGAMLGGLNALLQQACAPNETPSPPEANSISRLNSL